MAVRAIRGATQVAADDRDEVLDATRELVSTVLERNELDPADLISILFTATPDLVSEFPALAARELGLGDVPLMCATEIAVPHALPRVLRLMAHVETPKPRRGAARVPAWGGGAPPGHRTVSAGALSRSGDPGWAVGDGGSPASPAPWPPGWARPTWTPARCTARPPSRCPDAGVDLDDVDGLAPRRLRRRPIQVGTAPADAELVTVDGVDVAARIRGTEVTPRGVSR